MAEPGEPSSFNADVAATAVVATLVEKVQNVDDRTERMETTLNGVKSTVDRWGGALVIVGAVTSAFVSLVVAVITAVGAHSK